MKGARYGGQPEGTVGVRQPERDKAKAFRAASAVVPHDSRIRAIANVLEGLQQDRVCHIAAEIAHKDVKVGGRVALLFLEGPLDAHFL